MGVEDQGTCAWLSGENIPVEVICDPQSVLRFALFGVVVHYFGDEGLNIFLVNHGDGAATPACSCEARAEGACLAGHSDDFVELGAGAVIQLVTATL